MGQCSQADLKGLFNPLPAKVRWGNNCTWYKARQQRFQSQLQCKATSQKWNQNCHGQGWVHLNTPFISTPPFSEWKMGHISTKQSIYLHSHPREERTQVHTHYPPLKVSQSAIPWRAARPSLVNFDFEIPNSGFQIYPEWNVIHLTSIPYHRTVQVGWNFRRSC